jgi:hypothetical protein
MKFVKTLLALAAIGAVFSAQADSKSTSGAAGTALSADAHLDFRVVIPRVLFLRVGTGGPAFADNVAVDRMDFNLGTTDTLTPGNQVLGVNNAGGPLTVQVVGNGGNVQFSAVGSGTGLIDGTSSDVIPWAEILPSSSNVSLPHPGIGGGVSTLTATNRVFNSSATWSFNYANLASRGEGQYNGRVTYTAALP